MPAIQTAIAATIKIAIRATKGSDWNIGIPLFNSARYMLKHDIRAMNRTMEMLPSIRY
ncbi:hypothetical protein KDK_06740 [Dictyobacter kobayashii]|uniref:Uncharacterized protein n=1 Tax=Dictyobacter kobayashii TaxID=2014872 RepID=A0A402ACQ1_9CHLR|nr:hypothetical protein KDK_06740 [Dictyobacter kobayashii]